jgi:hypothetical protein
MGRHGPLLCADGRLLLTVEESDEHQEQRTYSVWSELDGSIRVMPESPQGPADGPQTPNRMSR